MTDTYPLAALGWAPDFLRQLTLDELATLTPCRISAVHRSRIEALSATGRLSLVLPPGLSTAEIAVGDWALCDGNRLEQVLINLIGNALDAVHPPERPRIEIACSQEADRVRVQVRDHGPGLADAAQAHLFEPFFTTKEAGVGLGLGLALSAGIVREFQGSLSGTNHPGGGALFTLELPKAPDGPPDTPHPSHD